MNYSDQYFEVADFYEISLNKNLQSTSLQSTNLKVTKVP